MDLKKRKKGQRQKIINMFIIVIVDMRKMTISGIGNEFTILSIIYGVTILFGNYFLFPTLTFTLGSTIVNIVVGSLIILVGFIMIGKALIIVRYFYDQKLCTKGLYAKVQHPMYFAWIVMIIPGFISITRLILGFTLPFFMYFLFRKLIHREEDYLEHLFGDEYLNYKKTTRRFFPAFKQPSKLS